MTSSKLQQAAESIDFSGLDLIVKYAVLLSWFVYGAGLTRISGFLRTLGVPTESSTYALPTVLSFGAYSIVDMLKIAGMSIFFVKLFEKETPRKLRRIIGWTMPAGLFVYQNFGLFRSSGPVMTRISYAVLFLTAAYILVYLFGIAEMRELAVGTQVLVAVFLFYLVVEGAGYRGDLDAYDAMMSPPSVQFLLAPETVAGANKLGISFSAVEPGLTLPLNVVAFTERMFYVRVPRKLNASQVQDGVRLEIGGDVTVAIPRDRVIMASVHK